MGQRGKRIDETKRQRIRSLLREGLSVRNVAYLAGVAKRTVEQEIKRAK